MTGMWLGLAAALLALFSKDVMDAATGAAGVFARGVMPALFPMMVLNGLVGGEKAERLGGAVLFSLLAGTPASSQRARRLWDAGALTERGMLALLAATGVMSPMFFVGTLAGWLSDARLGWVMLGAHWAGAMLAGLICRLPTKRPRGAGTRSTATLPAHGASHGARRNASQTRNAAAPAPGEQSIPQGGVLSMLPAALMSAAQALLAVCAAMMLFAMASAILGALLDATLLRALPSLASRAAPYLAVAHAALEIGGGCADMARIGMSPPLLCAMCGFGGLSLWMQSLLFVGECVRPVKLLCVRALHGAISYGLCAAGCALFGL